LLLVGTMHYLPDSAGRNWQEFASFLDTYKPDAICVEYWMPDDSTSLKQVDGGRYRAVLDSLANAWKIDKAAAQNRIKTLYAELDHADDLKKRIELYQLLHISADYGNADFQAWRAYQLTSTLTENEKQLLRKEWPGYRRIEWLVTGKLKNNEYGRVVFPLAVKYNITYLYPVDDRTYNMRFSIAYGKGFEELTGTKMADKIRASWDEFIKLEAEAIKKGNALMFINSNEWMERSNYMQAIQYENSGSIHNKDYVRYWNLRNEKVGVNILEQIKGKEFKKVAVFMGNLHIPNIKEHMKGESSVTIKTISDYVKL
jgi:hypothetical protein